MNLNRTAEQNEATVLTFSPIKDSTRSASYSGSDVIIIGRRGSLSSGAIAASMAPASMDYSSFNSVVDAMLGSIKGSGWGKATSFYRKEAMGVIIKITIILLPSEDKISRNNHPFSPHALTDALFDVDLDSAALEHIVEVRVLDRKVEEFACCASVAIARALPLYHSKSKRGNNDDSAAKMVNVSFYDEEGCAISEDSPAWETARAVADGVRLAARLGDMPPAELNPTSYAMECKSIADTLSEGGANVVCSKTDGMALKELGYGGIFGVGMAATCPPVMVVMTYTPEGGQWTEHVALCGKGVIYDTGGLSLKPKVGMCGMKHDMGGSAGLLGGFQAAVQLKVPCKITLILAIVENAIGPLAVRNDDVLTMKSGKTVEINNTDAEGRLVLADCVSYASNGLEGGERPDVILDMATLTGAQGVTTGKRHAGILSRTKRLEERVMGAGMRTGDLVFPMLYAPELLKLEFSSKIADMKNSVKDRSNAQASCAGHFIESHIDEAYEGDWVHVDMAYPSHQNERATGYGVALVLGLLNASVGEVVIS